MSHVLHHADEENQPGLRWVVFVPGAELCALSDLCLPQFQLSDQQKFFGQREKPLLSQASLSKQKK